MRLTVDLFALGSALPVQRVRKQKHLPTAGVCPIPRLQHRGRLLVQARLVPGELELGTWALLVEAGERSVLSSQRVTFHVSEEMTSLNELGIEVGFCAEALISQGTGIHRLFLDWAAESPSGETVSLGRRPITLYVTPADPRAPWTTELSDPLPIGVPWEELLELACCGAKEKQELLPAVNALLCWLAEKYLVCKKDINRYYYNSSQISSNENLFAVHLLELLGYMEIDLDLLDCFDGAHIAVLFSNLLGDELSIYGVTSTVYVLPHASLGREASWSPSWYSVHYFGGSKARNRIYDVCLQSEDKKELFLNLPLEKYREKISTPRYRWKFEWERLNRNRLSPVLISPDYHRIDRHQLNEALAAVDLRIRRRHRVLLHAQLGGSVSVLPQYVCLPDMGADYHRVKLVDPSGAVAGRVTVRHFPAPCAAARWLGQILSGGAVIPLGDQGIMRGQRIAFRRRNVVLVLVGEEDRGLRHVAERLNAALKLTPLREAPLRSVLSALRWQVSPRMMIDQIIFSSRRHAREELRVLRERSPHRQIRFGARRLWGAQDHTVALGLERNVLLVARPALREPICSSAPVGLISVMRTLQEDTSLPEAPLTITAAALLRDGMSALPGNIRWAQLEMSDGELRRTPSGGLRYDGPDSIATLTVQSLTRRFKTEISLSQ